MKKNLTCKETFFLTSMLFGMFFGAGNLIFPAFLGIISGQNLFLAYVGLFITAVGLPLLAVAVLGISRCEGIIELSARVGKGYSLFFSTLLYLTIGPLFAIPRCASTSFAVGAVNLLPEGISPRIPLVVFSLIFFLCVLFFSLKPGNVMTWIGKILNPLFLLFLGTLIVTALLHPVNRIADVAPTDAYQMAGAAFFQGFLEGYNTLDALAGLAFGIIVVQVIRKQGISDPSRVAMNTVKAGIFSCLLMGIIYLAIAVTAGQSYEIAAACSDGGAVLGTLANYYFHSTGALLITIIVTFACLKTAIGLVTSCGEAFVQMYPHGPSYRIWAIGFCIIGFGIANFGLSTIVAYCVPVLMFLYPLSITLIFLTLVGNLFHNDRRVYLWTTVFTMLEAILDFLNALSSTLEGQGFTILTPLQGLMNIANRFLPLYSIGMGWICPAIVGFGIGYLHYRFSKQQK